MSSFSDFPSTAENGTETEDRNEFRRKFLKSRQWRLPRRYVIAAMLFLLLLIKIWRQVTFSFMVTGIVVLEKQDTYPSLGNWTFEELDSLFTISIVVEFLAQMPGALLIFTIGSYNYLLIAGIVTSVFCILTPVALQHHSASLFVVLLCQHAFDAPLYTAIISTWKDWAPSSERTKLVMLSLCGMFLGNASGPFLSIIYSFLTTHESFYFAGIAGIVWTLLWYNIVSDTPRNDPLITESELSYLECNIPPDIHHKIQIKDVPWKSILSSKKMMILSVILFKECCSLYAISFGGLAFVVHLANYDIFYIFIPFLLAFIILIPCSAVIADILLNRFRGRSLEIRKYFLCGGFTLQCMFLFGVLSTSHTTAGAFFAIAYVAYVVSVPGYVSLPLEFSSRYVILICGILKTLYSLESICVNLFLDYILVYLHLNTIAWLFLLDGILTLASIVLFAVWGDDTEESWSQTLPSSPRPSGYTSYPKPEDEDDLNLVTENV